MHWPLRYLAFCLTACTGQEQKPADEAVVRVVDRAGQPVPRAVVWTLPSRSWERRDWIPAELTPYFGNPHELLRRLGGRHVADETGTVRVPRSTVVAGEHAGLAGATTVGEAGNAPDELVLDDWHWTVVVRDERGMPVAGVPVTCSPEQESPFDQFEGVPLGLTDAGGHLVVRDPGSVDVAKYMSRPFGGPNPAPPEFVLFEVDGMYLDAHAKKLSLKRRESGTVALTLPPVTRIEVRAPEWHGPVATMLTLTRIGKGMQWDNAVCWSESGQHFGLVGVPDPKHPTPIVAMIDGTTIKTNAMVPRLPAEETLIIQLHLDEGDTIVRALVHDASGKPAAFSVLKVKPTSDLLRTRFVRADREGRIALVLRPETLDGATVGLQVYATPTPDLLDSRTELKVEGLHPGDHCDAGVLILTR